MKYIKSINESFGKNTKELLTHFGITEKEYQEMIDIIGNCGYSEVGSKLPFYKSLMENEYEINSYDDLRKLVAFAEEKRSKMNKVEEFEDILLKWKEDPDSDIKVETDYNSGIIILKFPQPKDMGSFADKISEISKRINMNKIKHMIRSIIWDYNGGDPLTIIRLEVIQ